MRANFKNIILFILLFSNQHQIFAQLNVSVGQTPTQYAQQLVGNGVTVSNVTYAGFNGQSSGTAHSDQSGYYEFDVPIYQIGAFSNGNTTNLGIDAGIILSTGDVRDANNPASFFANSYTSSMAQNDQDLEDLGGQPYDKSILEFDFIPQGPTISFQFVFGSEEYPNWVNQSYNDKFGFFLSGPGIAGPFSNGAENIALIPSTSTPIAINNVNNGDGDCQPIFGSGGNNPPNGPCTNCQYYVSNCGGTTICYGGFTTVLTATYNVQCGSTYHIKLAIADVGDANWDSGIFIKKNSLESSTINITPDPIDICAGENVQLTANLPSGVSGGVFSWTPGGASTQSINVSPATSTDYIVNYTYSGCVLKDTATVNIIEIPTITNINISPCNNNLYSITGDVNFTTFPSSGDLVVEDCNGQQFIVASAPFSGSSYQMNLTGLSADGNACSLNVFFTDASNCDNTYNYNAPAPCAATCNYSVNGNATVCINSPSPNVNFSGSSGTAPYTFNYNINGGATQNFNSDGTGLGSLAAPTNAAGTFVYTLTSVTDANGTVCVLTGINTVTITVVTSNITPTFDVQGPYCVGTNFTLPTISNNFVSGTWSPAINTNSTTTYTFTPDPGQCSDIAQTTVTIVPEPVASFTANPTSGVAPIDITFTNNSTDANSYIWNFGNGNNSNSSSNQVINTYLSGGQYNIILTASNGICQDSINLIINIENPPSLIYHIPNVFTPNNDQKNDEFFIETHYAKSVFVEIFNRWGNLIKVLENQNEKWDGKNYSDGVYFFKYKITDLSDKVYEGHGFVHLVE